MTADSEMPRSATAKDRPGWRLAPWALCLVLGLNFLAIGSWSFAYAMASVVVACLAGLVPMNWAPLIEVSRLLLCYAAIVASGLIWCVCGVRCRRGSWREAGASAVLAAALWASFFAIWPGHDAWP